MFDKFNEGAQRALILGQEAAAREKHDHLGTEHIMFGLLQVPGEINSATFKRQAVNLRKVVEQVEKRMESNAVTEAMADVPFSEKAKKAIELSVDISKGYGEEAIGQEHLLLGMLAVEESDAAMVFKDAGVEDIRKFEDGIRGEIESSKKRKSILAMLNEPASKALVQAREEARQNWNEIIGTEHILLGLLKDQENLAMAALKKLGVDMRLLQKAIKEITPPGIEKPAEGTQPHFDLEAKMAIDNAAGEAREMSHNYIGPEHLLLGILAVKTCAGASALNRTGVSNIKKMRITISREMAQK
jgi:ATP-dependent Clp protease ATP-binding subunit ClpC